MQLFKGQKKVSQFCQRKCVSEVLCGLSRSLRPLVRTKIKKNALWCFAVCGARRPTTAAVPGGGAVRSFQAAEGWLITWRRRWQHAAGSPSCFSFHCLLRVRMLSRHANKLLMTGAVPEGSLRRLSDLSIGGLENWTEVLQWTHTARNDRFCQGGSRWWCGKSRRMGAVS